MKLSGNIFIRKSDEMSWDVTKTGQVALGGKYGFPLLIFHLSDDVQMDEVEYLNFCIQFYEQLTLAGITALKEAKIKKAEATKETSKDTPTKEQSVTAS